MNNLFLFVLSLILIILLLALSIFSTKAAISVFNSSEYNNQASVRTAHQYLTIAASLSWSSLVTLLLIAAVSVFAGIFATDQELTVSGTSILLGIVIILTLLVIITTILIIYATIQLGNVTSKDDNINTAYKDGIIGSVLGASSIGASIVLTITFYALFRKKEKPKKDGSEIKKEISSNEQIKSD